MNRLHVDPAYNTVVILVWYLRKTQLVEKYNPRTFMSRSNREFSGVV
ncbi:MAG: hypothetical protein PHS44_02355 [Candidatus Dojkabacteria bacterium]|nr:hypothetical protein [Candidatus Dojkabacteria bacterium]